MLHPAFLPHRRHLSLPPQSLSRFPCSLLHRPGQAAAGWASGTGPALGLRQQRTPSERAGRDARRRRAAPADASGGRWAARAQAAQGVRASDGKSSGARGRYTAQRGSGSGSGLGEPEAGRAARLQARAGVAGCGGSGQAEGARAASAGVGPERRRAERRLVAQAAAVRGGWRPGERACSGWSEGA
jgi:hypothetical protein